MFLRKAIPLPLHGIKRMNTVSSGLLLLNNQFIPATLLDLLVVYFFFRFYRYVKKHSPYRNFKLKEYRKAGSPLLLQTPKKCNDLAKRVPSGKQKIDRPRENLTFNRIFPVLILFVLPELSKLK